MSFDSRVDRVVQVKIGISFVSIANARDNLARENDPEAFAAPFDFASLQAAANIAWNVRLNQIQVKGGSPDALTAFYTALYHSFIHPNVFSDANGQYLGFDGSVHTVNPRHAAQYHNIPGWDHGSPLPRRARLVPGQGPGGHEHGGAASITLEYAHTDFAIAQFAKGLDRAKHDELMRHSQNWKNRWNADAPAPPGLPFRGYLAPRNADGAFVGGWSAVIRGPTWDAWFREGNASQYLWMVEHDRAALVLRLGGRDTARLRLDDHFGLPRGGRRPPEGERPRQRHPARLPGQRAGIAGAAHVRLGGRAQPGRRGLPPHARRVVSQRAPRRPRQ